jgi:3-isopropylmalate/(R)-2-methylmalate dehydratase large subunit
MTLTEQIIAKKAGLDAVRPGQLVECELDLMLANDVTAPVSINEFNKKGFKTVKYPEKVVLVMDHFTPNKDIKSAENVKTCREFAKVYGIEKYFEGGEAGIEHALLPEKGFVKPCDCIIGADSHTCTYGALGAFSTGVGSTDLTYGMVSGKVWLKVPRAILFNISGRFNEGVTGKDLILTIIGKIGVSGALYKSMEFRGDLSALTIDDRFTIANMAIEAGGKNGIFEVDDITRRYLKEVGADFETHGATDNSGGAGSLGADFDKATPPAINTDDYDEIYDINLGDIKPCAALPSLPENVAAISELPETAIDQVVIGSCTNGRISDLRQAAEVLKGKKVAKNVRCIIFPATPKIWADALREGLLETFITAGCIIAPPSCGPCLGGHLGILAAGERAVSTTNRNFVGRMGSPRSEVYLASPITAAHSAISGKIGNPDVLIMPKLRNEKAETTSAAANKLDKNISGKTFVYGDNVDTDVIIPARYLNASDDETLRTHCMEDIDADFAATVAPGDFIAAGINFGCGSSREHAPLAIKAAGIKCVIAKSFARIFYRNAINTGLAILETADAEKIHSGDRLEIDLRAGEIRNITKNETYKTEGFPTFIEEIIKKGGLL